MKQEQEECHQEQETQLGENLEECHEEYIEAK
jgi:hypothetical protein